MTLHSTPAAAAAAAMGKDAGGKQEMTQEKEIPKQTIIWPIDYAFGSLVCMLGFVADGVDWTRPGPSVYLSASWG